MGLTYKGAGVDIEAGASLVDRIKPLVAATRRPEVLGGIGGFAGLCTLPSRYREPVLVSGTDGTGTKLLVAIATGQHDTIGIDLVAMCVNDIIVTGAEPLFFLDYFVTGALDVEVAARVIGGIAEGCKQAGCALIGGETAEHPGEMAPGHYDLAGFCVGVVERDEIRDPADIATGDVILGLPSSGLHSNGYSLARRVVFDELGMAHSDRHPSLGDDTVGQVLLRPTRIYARDLAALADAGVRFKGAAHVTGGGLHENLPRMLPSSAALELDRTSWEVPPIFALIQSAGVDADEMDRTFNMGIGMAVAVAAADVEPALATLPDDARVIGRVVDASSDRPRVSFV